ncbi:MAG TPA: hypothetical protein VHO90_15025 [Bacteroidales bacterium]|nr:hypothetical protein [Bacteroidales bacterium]
MDKNENIVITYGRIIPPILVAFVISFITTWAVRLVLFYPAPLSRLLISALLTIWVLLWGLFTFILLQAKRLKAVIGDRWWFLPLGLVISIAFGFVTAHVFHLSDKPNIDLLSSSKLQIHIDKGQETSKVYLVKFDTGYGLISLRDFELEGGCQYLLKKIYYQDQTESTLTWKGVLGNGAALSFLSENEGVVINVSVNGREKPIRLLPGTVDLDLGWNIQVPPWNPWSTFFIVGLSIAWLFYICQICFMLFVHNTNTIISNPKNDGESGKPQSSRYGSVLKFFSQDYRRVFYLFTILAGSLAIFLSFLVQNRVVSYYDESGYAAFADVILTRGLFNLGNNDLRTYFFPLLIAVFKLFTNGDWVIVKTFFSIFQYLIYLSVIIFIALSSHRFTQDDRIVLPILAGGFVNPYIIQTCTLFGNDALSACVMIISVFFAIFGDFSKKRDIFLSIGFAVINVMIRPTSLIYLFGIGGILLIRVLMRNVSFSPRLILVGVSCLLFFFPQIYHNVTDFDKLTPLVAQDLYSQHTTAATNSLKYATVVIPGEIPQLIYQNPFINPQTHISIWDLLGTHFDVFLYVVGVHFFAIIDWAYVDAFIRDYYPTSRLLASAWLYICWFFSIFGLLSYSWQDLKRKLISLKQAYRPDDAFLLLLIPIILVYIAFIVTSSPESRFGYPLFLLCLPFMGLGVSRATEQVNKAHPSKRWKYLGTLTILLIAFIIIMFFLSFSLDKMTGRIDWLGYLFSGNG